jgi:hypothetical protein
MQVDFFVDQNFSTVSLLYIQRITVLGFWQPFDSVVIILLALKV